jgi:hypothetical protein
MARRLRNRLTYSNVIATLALFVALGGGAYAASRLPKNSVGSKQLKANSVTAAKIKNGAVTGPKIKLSTLGAVPNATRADSAGHADTAGDSSTLQGNGPSTFVHGNGQLFSVRRELSVGDTNQEVVPLPGIGNLTATCEAGPEAQFSANNTSGTIMDQTFESGESTDGGSATSGKDVSWGGKRLTYRIQLSTRAPTPTLATLNIAFKANGPAPCTIFVQALVGK